MKSAPVLHLKYYLSSKLRMSEEADSIHSCNIVPASFPELDKLAVKETKINQVNRKNKFIEPI
jgi:hypothetical protein